MPGCSWADATSVVKWVISSGTARLDQGMPEEEQEAESKTSSSFHPAWGFSGR